MTEASIVDAGEVIDEATGRSGSADPPAGGVRRWLGAAIDRPVLATALVGMLVAGVNLRWILANRAQGGFDGDETSYLATAIRLRETLGAEGLVAFASEAMSNYRNGPLVPALSALAIQQGRPLASAMAIQPLFHLIAAVAVAATVERLAGRRAALVGGIATLGLPALLLSARSYQLVMGATACLAIAVWALVRSDRGRSVPHLLVFGAAVGAMLLSRTVMVSFLPGLVVAAVVLVERTRRSLLALGAAGAIAVVVAAPWWVGEWSNSIAPYLLRYGYGEGAAPLGPESPLARVGVRLGLLMADVRVLLIGPAIAAFVAGLLAGRRSIRAAGWRTFVDRHRELVAIWSIVGLGWLALLSSSNIGTYFQLPLEVVAIVGLVSLPIRSAWFGRLGPWVVAAALLNVALMSNWAIGSSVRVGGSTLSLIAFGGVEVSQAIDFENSDPRFAPTASDAERQAAMAEWAAVHDHTAFAVQELTPEGGEVRQTFLGDVRLFQATSLALAAELTGLGRSPWEAPTATSTIGDGRVDLAPTDADGRPRVLVAVRATTYTEQEGLPADEVLAEATALGWMRTTQVPLPDGGQVELYVHPDNLELHGLAP
jgi:4-amino-4-deoxy-L-arabinose transferase-like glycosyltransferase